MASQQSTPPSAPLQSSEPDKVATNDTTKTTAVIAPTPRKYIFQDVTVRALLDGVVLDTSVLEGLD